MKPVIFPLWKKFEIFLKVLSNLKLEGQGHGIITRDNTHTSPRAILLHSSLLGGYKIMRQTVIYIYFWVSNINPQWWFHSTLIFVEFEIYQCLKWPTKDELLQVGIFFAFNFLPWDFLSIKRLEIEKTKTTLYTTFKTDTIKVVFVFWFQTFLLSKIPREVNWVRFSCFNSALLILFKNRSQGWF